MAVGRGDRGGRGARHDDRRDRGRPAAGAPGADCPRPPFLHPHRRSRASPALRGEHAPCQLLPDGHGSAGLRQTHPWRRARARIWYPDRPPHRPGWGTPADHHAHGGDRSAGRRGHRSARLDLQRHHAWPDTRPPPGGARRGAAAQRERRPGGDDPLARRRRAGPGGRRCRGHAGCRPARRAVPLPIRRARCGDLLVPHASGLGPIRCARTPGRAGRPPGHGATGREPVAGGCHRPRAHLRTGHHTQWGGGVDRGRGGRAARWRACA